MQEGEVREIMQGKGQEREREREREREQNLRFCLLYCRQRNNTRRRVRKQRMLCTPQRRQTMTQILLKQKLTRSVVFFVRYYDVVKSFLRPVYMYAHVCSINFAYMYICAIHKPYFLPSHTFTYTLTHTHSQNTLTCARTHTQTIVI